MSYTERCGLGESLLFEFKISMEIHLGGLRRFMAKPKGDYRAVYAVLKELHGGRVTEHMGCDALLFEGRTVLPGSFRMFCQKVLDSFRTQRMASCVGKHGIRGPSVALTEPGP